MSSYAYKVCDINVHMQCYQKFIKFLSIWRALNLSHTMHAPLLSLNMYEIQ